ncbi:AP-4 complex subunit beta-1 [Mortierella hygrophila]|uniref:AP-4 complex subunit beta-1 n=1 Tax=Mortierella hygrophila TaxID=979708 RepID=A0A9P6FHG2_9FUNG|nr:AP-4 complex subunit beta-1 [Mortierella hygrophila]
MDVAELTEAFKGQAAHPDHALLMQRVQELMGQGIDVSTFFATMVSSASTRDIAIKKIAYAFLARYGHTNEELCFLGINTLHQDCVDLDPTIRALALRTLCSLGQRSVMRFMLQPLNKGFHDKNANVRKTAVMACISLFELDPSFFLGNEIVDKLYGLLSDKDTQVVVNAILALETILVDEGGVVVNRAIAQHLIRRYKDWTPGQLQVVLGVLCRYKPETDDEIYEIMNDVDDGLQHASLAVQMATLRLFIWLCQDLAEIDEDVQTTIEETLLKHLESPHPDLVFASLHHLALILEKSGRLRHSSPQHLSVILHNPNDPIVIALKKLELCRIVAQFSLLPVTTFILDHLCLVASMKEMAQLQQSSRTKLDRQYISAQLEVVCAAIESIGAIGLNYGSRQRHDNGAADTGEFEGGPANESATPLTRDEIEKMKKTVNKTCLDRLYQLLVLVSDLGNETERQKGNRGSLTWNHQNLAGLNLDESQVAMIQSTLLLSIEGCWQRNYESMRYQGDLAQGRGEYHGIMDASQVRILGLLLLRHLDQDELDRMAKRWKPLRYRYDTADGGVSQSASSSAVDLHQHQQQRAQSFPGDISRLARISGLRMLLLEESIQHYHIMKPLSTKHSAKTTDILVVASPVEDDDSGLSAAAKAAIEKRLPYVELLQQQVQDMVQSIDTVPYSSTAAGPSDSSIRATRDEQLAILHLACHLVAFSIEHQDASQVDQTHFVQRLAILAQAVGRLTMGEERTQRPPRQPVTDGGDLLTLDTDAVPPGKDAANTDVVTVRSKVSRDVVDQAQLIHSLFLRPLLDATSEPTTTELPPLLATTQSFDSPFFKTEKYRQLVHRKLVDQFGVRPKSTATDQDQTTPPIDMVRLLHHDWYFQIGFNTLAALR